MKIFSRNEIKKHRTINPFKIITKSQYLKLSKIYYIWIYNLICLILTSSQRISINFNRSNVWRNKYLNKKKNTIIRIEDEKEVRKEWGRRPYLWSTSFFSLFVTLAKKKQLHYSTPFDFVSFQTRYNPTSLRNYLNQRKYSRIDSKINSSTRN